MKTDCPSSTEKHNDACMRRRTKWRRTSERRLGVPPPPTSPSRPTRADRRAAPLVGGILAPARSTKRAAPRATQTFITSCWRTSASAPSATRPLPARDRSGLIFLRRRKSIECPNAARSRARSPSTVASGQQAARRSTLGRWGQSADKDGGSGGLGAAAAESSVYTISVRSRVGAWVCEMRATGSRQGGRRPDRSELLSSSADTRGDDVSRRPTRPWPGDRRFVTNIAGRPRLQ